MIFGKKKCIKETVGTVVRLYDKGNDFPFVMRVEYIVDGQKYYVEETVKMINEKIRKSLFVVGQRQIPVIHELEIGRQVTVLYNPSKPKRAYIKENVGHINC